MTLAAATVRVDLALPADPPLIELMTDVLDLAQVGPAAGHHHGWQLSRTGGAPLDPGLSLSAQQVRDGDVLYLDQQAAAPAPPVYDDLAEAIGVAATAAARPWADQAGPAARRVLAAVLILAAGHALWQLPAVSRPGPVGIGAATLLVAVAGLIRWAGGNQWTVVLVGAAGVVSAALGGLRLDPDHRAADWLGGSTGLLVAAVAALLVCTGTGRSARARAAASRTGVLLFSAGSIVGLAGVLVLGVADQLSAPTSSAAAAALVLGWIFLRLSPRIALRLASIPVPPPATHHHAAPDPDHLRQQSGAAQQRAGLAVWCLAGLTTGATIITGCAAVVLVTTPNRWGWLLAGVGLAVVLLQARSVTRVVQMLALLIPTATAGVCGLLVLEQHLTGSTATVRPALWLLLAAGVIGVGVVLPKLRPTPGIRRLRTMVEALLTASLIPLALAAMDAYQAIRHL